MALTLEIKSCYFYRELPAKIPCDPEYPAERINQIIEDSNAPYVITTADRLTDEKFIDVEELLAHENSARP